MRIKSLSDAIKVSDVISIDGVMITEFEVTRDGKFVAQKGDRNFFLTEQGLEKAVYNINGFWETSCGHFSCFLLQNIALQ